MIIYLLTLDGAFDTGLGALLDVFAVANELAESAGLATPRFSVTLLGVRKQVTTAQGLIVPVVTGTGLPRPDMVIVPALGAKKPETLLIALQRRDVAEAGRLLRHWNGQGALIAAACTATFILAEARLLNGLSATTSWWLAALFRTRYSLVSLDESRMLVESGRIVTAGAALAHVDLALHLVRRSDPELAALTAKYFVADPRRSQAPYVVPNHLGHCDPVLDRFERWARNHLADGFSLKDAAFAAGASERTLARRLRGALGKSPLSYFQDLRVECAAHLLHTTSASVEQIAQQVGYSNAATLRLLLRRKLDRSARQLRSIQV
ncbi:helix-turn-helix domain-containing protein [Rhodoblastus acidophilus]|uniref:Helix-turn-helix domain-containing protein n=1 Tax=Candidatus Rhodoblastus alkanivorans TaxID=2954117 RepID=A0ABS9ZB75_9HYPH|nr:helix-turn-helix domain-containing protein [Candidatus Rhodoblastus alkanivorans]MCI4680499.1 helix-turn-helix domain-containing protein [Candidatus Rhodoblastus alkanivorans]MCI4684973.1 helix-turn-helix domain-containing protein [Candidatus Rhodoblastus alkanivorans]MDI4643119.1 helix-turn-helix domain-containing protein [Rhodoblastus acidophilus]